MAILTVRDVSISFRGPALLDQVSFQVEPGERIALVGRNGAGKTTLLAMLCGQVAPDHGEIALSPGATVALLPQDVPAEISGLIREVVAGGVAHAAASHDTAWQAEQQVERIIADMQLPADARFENLSAGMKRRALLGRALVSEPDVLLLDEPTNHLDVDAIRWLEEYLGRIRTTLMFVTHDRAFLRRLATRILEIDRGRLFDWTCDYDTFLVRKEDLLAAEEKQNALFDKRLAEEEAWIRTGIKARRTRNEGRVRALEAMRRQRSLRRSTAQDVTMAIQEAQRSGTLVARLDGVSFSYGENPIVRDLSTTILRGDKVGIFGPNGAGKTTLLRLVLGKLSPTAGAARLGTNLEIAYFDQLREQLDPERSVQDNVGDGYETVKIGGRPRHVIGYLEEFLFSPERSRTLVRFLSGGECNRVLLAKLFAKPANVIVLDEPTNDLDAETLELLESLLVEFSGTVLVVSHDRTFLDNVVTSSIVFEDGDVKEYVGGYSDWQRQRAEREAAAVTEPSAAAAARTVRERPNRSADKSGKRRLSFKDQQELAALPAAIERLEAEVARLHDDMAGADFYRQPGEQIAAAQELLKQLEADLRRAYVRWQELEAGQA